MEKAQEMDMELELAARDAVILRLRNATQDLVETLDGADPGDPVDSVAHLIGPVQEELSRLNVMDGPDEELSPEDMPEEDDPDAPPCECCDGAGFGYDAEGTVACVQCGGSGLQPANVPPIDTVTGDED